ncbi:MAG: synthase subunit [Bacteroidota bacterium]|jgi:F-type H+-transporting ATPase subunit b|nr:ATP synthase F0 subunit B [Chitinophagia bacterium]
MDLLLPGIGLLFWTLLAFGMVFFVLRKYAWRIIIDSLNEREKGIADSLDAAKKVKAEMTQLKSENEALMAQAREERSQLLKEAKEAKDKMINEAKEQAKAEAAKIMSDANAAIQSQKMAALTEIKNQIGNMVIEVSEKVIRKQLDNKAEQEKYIQQMASELNQFGN